MCWSVVLKSILSIVGKIRKLYISLQTLRYTISDTCVLECSEVGGVGEMLYQQNILERRLCCLLLHSVFTTWLWDQWTLLLKVKLQVYSLISRQACSVDFFSLPLVIGIDRLTDHTVVKLLGLPLRRPHCWVNTGFCEGLFYSTLMFSN